MRNGFIEYNWGQFDLMRRTVIRRQCCPVCHAAITRALDLDGDRVPKHNDVCVCFACGSFLAFARFWRMRLMTSAEIATLADDVRIKMQRIRRAIDAARKEQKSC